MDVQGAQVVHRIGAVLRAVGAASPTGCTTSEVAVATVLSRPTTHRLLTSLQADGLTDRDAAGRWFLGPEIYLMGVIAADRYDVTRYAREVVEELSDLTGESAFLSARRQSETICLLRVEGSFPIRSFVLYEGVRFPLGVASAGLAILSHLPPEEVERYLARSDLTARWGPSHAPDELRARIQRTRERGYSLNPGLIVEGSWGMGAAVFSAAGRPEWALSLTGVDSRFRPDRQQELGRQLLKSAHTLTRTLRQPFAVP